MGLSDNLNADVWNKVFKINKDIVSRKIAGELFLVPIRGKMADMQEIFTLNAVGEYIWQEIDSQKNINDIRDSVIETFDVVREKADSDIQEFIKELLEEELIRE